jgi:pimeloyl-ACP methyl ester carboxylesterase
MAASLGPSEHDARTKTTDHSEGYGSTVIQRARSPAALLWQMTGLYRNGVLRGRWLKSKETLASIPKTSIHPPGAENNESRLQAPATVVWGNKDHVLMPEICLHGLHKFLAPGSEVFSLPRTGHWVPVETESIQVILEVLRYHTTLHLQKDRLGQNALKRRYKDARLVTRT